VFSKKKKKKNSAIRVAFSSVSGDTEAASETWILIFNLQAATDGMTDRIYVYLTSLENCTVAARSSRPS